MARNFTISKQRERRTIRTRAKVSGDSKKPRIAIFRSNEHISAQLIDDVQGVTLCAAHDRELKKMTVSKKETHRIAEAYAVGKLLADKAAKKKIKQAVFDRRGSKFHGRIAAFARGAREGGLHF